MRMHHVAVSVSDVATSTTWYCDNFNYAKVIGAQSPVFGEFALLENKNGERIELVQHEQPVPLPDERKELESDIAHIGIKHIGFVVDDLEKHLNS